MQVGGTRSNISRMDRIEKSFREAITHFEASNQITLEWFGEFKRRIVDITSKIETNRKKLHGLQQQTDGSIIEIARCQATVKVHEDRNSQLEQKLQELAQAQLAENLQVQQLLGEAALKEIREKVDKLKEAAQTVTISVPYLQ